MRNALALLTLATFAGCADSREICRPASPPCAAAIDAGCPPSRTRFVERLGSLRLPRCRSAVMPSTTVRLAPAGIGPADPAD